MNDLYRQFPLAHRYQQIKAKHALKTNIIIRDKTPEHGLPGISEKFIQYLWSEQMPEGIPYQTVDGRRIEVIFPGYWNLQGGPDFTVARLRIGDELETGDIELHLYSSDWYEHKHHLDANYNNVILHISFWKDNDDVIRSHNKQNKPQLILSSFLKEKWEEIDKLIELDPMPPAGSRFGGVGKCYHLCRTTNSKKIRTFLENAAHARMVNKIEKFGNQLDRLSSDYDELLYYGLMVALGYKNNQTAFRQLAGTAPLRDLRKLCGLSSDRDHPLLLQAYLFRQAGFLSKSDRYQAAEYFTILNKLKLPPSPLPDPPRWNLAGVRPANSPHRRLAGISYFLAKYLNSDKSIVNGLIGIFHPKTAPERLAEELKRMFYIPPLGYWATRSSFTATPFRKPVALIGAARVNEIVTNVIIPLLSLYAHHNKDKTLFDSVLAFYNRLPPLSENYITNFMKYRMFRTDSVRYDKIISNAVTQQGLFQIYNDFCKKGYDGCEACGFINELSG